MVMVKQQADELDALKRIGLNLTSSLGSADRAGYRCDRGNEVDKEQRARLTYFIRRGALDFEHPGLAGRQ